MTCRTNKSTEVCSGCAYWVIQEEAGHAVCSNNKSDHFAHLIYGEHPACQWIKRVQEGAGK